MKFGSYVSTNDMAQKLVTAGIGIAAWLCFRSTWSSNSRADMRFVTLRVAILWNDLWSSWDETLGTSDANTDHTSDSTVSAKDLSRISCRSASSKVGGVGQGLYSAFLLLLQEVAEELDSSLGPYPC